MNWEKSKALTPLKRDFLKAFFEREHRFFLTGGSALGIFYLQHRCAGRGRFLWFYRICGGFRDKRFFILVLTV